MHSSTLRLRSLAGLLALMCVAAAAEARATDLPTSAGGVVQSPDGPDEGQHWAADRRPSKWAKNIRIVVIAALQTAGVCTAGNIDWRSTLPRYIASQLDDDTQVLVWNVKDDLRKGRVDVCAFCDPVLGIEGGMKKTKQAFDCESWWGQQQSGAQADLVIAIGSGEEAGHYEEINHIFKKPWVGKKTYFMHIPISRSEDVLHNKVAKFDLVLPDEMWVKPIHLDHIEEFRSHCKDQTRDNTLAYIARYHTWKGQVEFLEKIDPALLKNYTIEFFSSVKSGKSAYVPMLESLAKSRGISVTVHKNPMKRDELLQSLCRAKGAVHFALTDANPRALYEELLAGLPVFISSESRIPPVVASQRFIKMTSSAASASQINKDFVRYTSILENRSKLKLDRKIDSFIRHELAEDQALRHMCIHMGICAKQEL